MQVLVVAEVGGLAIWGWARQQAGGKQMVAGLPLGRYLPGGGNNAP